MKTDIIYITLAIISAACAVVLIVIGSNKNKNKNSRVYLVRGRKRYTRTVWAKIFEQKIKESDCGYLTPKEITNAIRAPRVLSIAQSYPDRFTIQKYGRGHRISLKNK